MSKKRKARIKPDGRPNRPPQSPASRTLESLVLVAVLAFVAGAVGCFGITKILNHSSVKSVTTIPTLADFLSMTPDELSRQDIALMDLRCGEGLPGSEKLDVAQCLAALDDWAQQVRSYTNISMSQFRRDPRNFNNSEGYFRILCLITKLQRDLSVHYNPNRITDPDFRNSKDLFIHGMIHDSNGGTCASMPVLYVAVGRRLGYPLKLVSATSHLFARWDDGMEKFNIEGTNHGLTVKSDDYYKTWPHKLTQRDEKVYLKSMNAAEELATFLESRGDCLESNKKLPEAQLAYAEACELDSKMPSYLMQLANTIGEQLPQRTAYASSPQTTSRRFGSNLVDVDPINETNRLQMEQQMRQAFPNASSAYGQTGIVSGQTYPGQMSPYTGQPYSNTGPQFGR